MNIKYHTLERVTVPDAWKIWVVSSADYNTCTLTCLAVVATRNIALSLRKVLIGDGYSYADVCITRSHTIAMEVADDESTN